MRVAHLPLTYPQTLKLAHMLVDLDSKQLDSFRAFGVDAAIHSKVASNHYMTKCISNELVT